MKPTKTLLINLLLASPLAMSSSGSNVAAQQNNIKDYRVANEHRILEEFVTLLHSERRQR